MKKTLSLIMVLALSLSLFAACSQTGTAPAKETPSSTSEAAPSTVDEASEVPAEGDSANAEGDGAVLIYLTRHGKTMLNTTDRVQGWADSPLTEAGVEVAKQLGRGLALSDVQFDAAYSSDSGRSIETAHIVLEQVEQADLELHQLKDIREWNFGGFEGAYNDEMIEGAIAATGYNGEQDIRVGLPLNELADGIAAADETKTAENWEAIAKRSKSGIDYIAQTTAENGGGTVLVVAHGLTINSILKVIDPDHQTLNISNAAVSLIKYVDGKYEVLSVNDSSYVEKGKAS